MVVLARTFFAHLNVRWFYRYLQKANFRRKGKGRGTHSALPLQRVVFFKVSDACIHYALTPDSFRMRPGRDFSHFSRSDSAKFMFFNALTAPKSMFFKVWVVHDISLQRRQTQYVPSSTEIKLCLIILHTFNHQKEIQPQSG